MTEQETNAAPITDIEDLVTLPPDVMRRLCKAIDSHSLMVALKAVPEEVRSAVFAGFPPRRAGVMADTVPAIGFVTAEEIMEAQRQVVAAANLLAGFGKMLDD